MHIKNTNQTSDQPLQWHPAFYAGLQIEFENEADNLTFENEHQLGTKPKVLDVLIIKKNSTIPVQKNIGRIFRTHNIIEYKSPDDSLSIDDFYLVYAYVCIYKSDTKHVDEISAEEITITLVSSKYPRKLIKHLTDVRKYTVKFVENGIYYIQGDFFPIQIIVSRKLSKEENFWLHNLRNDITDKEDALCILDQYKKHSHEKLYSSVIDIIANANHTIFQEVRSMSEVLRRLYEKQIDEIVKEEVKEQVEKQVKERVEKQVKERVEEQIKEQVEEQVKKAIAEKDAYIKKLEAMLGIQANASAQS